MNLSLDRIRARWISAIIPIRNQAHLLPTCLDSLLGQKHGMVPGEILVIDDGSTDDVGKVVARYRSRSRRIRLYRIDAGNANRARIFGLSMARGRYILLADADNWLEPDFVARTLRALLDSARTDTPAVFAYGDRIMHFEADWHPDHPKIDSKPHRVVAGPFDENRLRRGNYIDMCSLLVRSAVQLDPTLKWYQDWDLWLRLAGQGQRGVYVPETAFHYRVHEGSQTCRHLQVEDTEWLRLKQRYHMASITPPKVSLILIARTREEVDAACAKLREQDYPNVEFCTSTAEGFARAYQDALDQVTGEIVVFTETDCTPLSPHWLSELVAEVRPNEVVHGLTVTDATPNMANTACYAEVARRFPRNLDYGPAEDTEWLLRMQDAGVGYRQVHQAAVFHSRPFVRQRMKERAYQYGWDWSRLIRRYHYCDRDELVARFETERAIAEEVLQGMNDEANRAKIPAVRDAGPADNT